LSPLMRRSGGSSGRVDFIPWKVLPSITNLSISNMLIMECVTLLVLIFFEVDGRDGDLLQVRSGKNFICR
jgi:hypothetical protein